MGNRPIVDQSLPDVEEVLLLANQVDRVRLFPDKGSRVVFAVIGGNGINEVLLLLRSLGKAQCAGKDYSYDENNCCSVHSRTPFDLRMR